MLFAGFLRKEPVELVKCETVDLEVPARAEVILEGYVDPSETRLEGPFGDHTGYCSLADHYPVFHLTCVTPQKPHLPGYNRGPAADGRRIFRKSYRADLSALNEAYAARTGGCEYASAKGVSLTALIVSIKKRYPGHARKVM